MTYDSRNNGRYLQPAGEASPMAKLDNKDIREIRAGLARGECQLYLAELYGVSQTLISRINRGVAWAHVE